jgi:arabinofuranan 3-O-arabinosyltransferase
LRVYHVAAGLLLLVFVPYYVLTLDTGWPIPRDGTGLAVGRDFINFWMYGRAAFEPDPARYYDIATYWAAMAPITGPGFPGQLWSYPPSVMLAAAPFGTLPYFAALALWTALGLAAFTAGLRLWTKDWRVLAPLLLGPAAIFGLISGQFAFVAAAIMLAVLRWRESRPLLAGLLLGLLTLKPQLGLFFPVLLLAAGNWRTIAAAAATALAIAGATALLWGPEVWTAYLQSGIANQSLVLSDPEKLGGPFMPTIFMNLRVAGLPFAAAMAVQAAAALAAIVLIWAAFRRRPEPGDLRANALFLAAAIFGTPYMLSYDTLALAAVMLLLAARGRGRLLPLLAFLLPLLQLAAGSAGLPGPALVPVLIAAHLFRRRDRGQDGSQGIATA